MKKVSKVSQVAIALALLLLVLVGTLGLDSGYTTIVFEGEFSETSYGTLQDGVYSMRFAIYDASIGGTQIWPYPAEYEEHPSVFVTAGRFSVELGSEGQPLSGLIDLQGERHVQVSVCQPAVLPAPRLFLVPSGSQVINSFATCRVDSQTEVWLRP